MLTYNKIPEEDQAKRDALAKDVCEIYNLLCDVQDEGLKAFYRRISFLGAAIAIGYNRYDKSLRIDRINANLVELRKVYTAAIFPTDYADMASRFSQWANSYELNQTDIYTVKNDDPDRSNLYFVTMLPDESKTFDVKDVARRLDEITEDFFCLEMYKLPEYLLRGNLISIGRNVFGRPESSYTALHEGAHPGPNEFADKYLQEVYLEHLDKELEAQRNGHKRKIVYCVDDRRLLVQCAELGETIYYG